MYDRRWIMKAGARSAEKHPATWGIISAIVMIPLFITMVSKFNLAESEYPVMDLLLIAVVGYFAIGNTIRLIFRLIKDSKETDSNEVKGNAKINKDNLYIQIFPNAKLNNSFLFELLTSAFARLEESEWEEAYELFCKAVNYPSIVPYAKFGFALCKLRINSIDELNSKINELERNQDFEYAVKCGGELITGPIQQFVRASSAHTKRNETNVINSHRQIKSNASAANQTAPKATEEKSAPISNRQAVILKKIEKLDREGKLLYLSNAIENDEISFEEYSELCSKI